MDDIFIRFLIGGLVVLFWELFGVNLCSLFGVKLGMQELAELSAETRDIALSHFRAA
jgi:hypothetical protein